MIFRLVFYVTMIAFSSLISAKSDTQSAVTAPIPVYALKNYANYPLVVRSLISTATALSKENITYLYGSADPKNKGMDCSGTIYYLLNTAHVKNVPRDANGMFHWVSEKGHLQRVSNQQFNSEDFVKLKPGDLLFWSGTYTAKNNASISHVMMYLGVTKDNVPLMFGSSNGRSYQGKKMWGVSVFDFKIPEKESRAKFIGYSCVPELTC